MPPGHSPTCPLTHTARRWYVASIIVGATTLEQLAENIDAVEAIELDEATLAEIEAIHLTLRNPNIVD